MSAMNVVGSAGHSPAPPSHVLLIEDEALIAFEAEDLLGDLGVGEVSLCANYEQAERAIDDLESKGAGNGDLPLGLFDMNLNGRLSTPLIERFVALGGKVVVATGYELDPEMVERLGVVHLVKPYDEHRLRRALDALGGR